RHTKTSRAPLAPEKAKQKREEHQSRQAEMDEAVGEWFAQTQATAEALAVCFHVKPRYFLDIFFQGGARMVHHHGKINPYHVFKALKAEECQE
ncbi:hypothetical protein B0H10DRAFT_1752304, partial [Mycena sp. CBHHK59/15]